jgi:hypothetical protein
MIQVFQIPVGGVNAMYNNGDSFAVIAPGRFQTTDDKLAEFLRTYPNVEHIEDREEVFAPISAAQFGPRPAQVKVIKGFSWEGVKGKQGAR